MKVAHKLALGFGIVLLLMLGTLAADVFASTQQSAVADRLVHHLYPAREAAEQILTWDRSADDDGGAYLLSRDTSMATIYLQSYDQDVQMLHAALAQAKALADTPVQRNDLQAFTSFYFSRGGHYQVTQTAFAIKHQGQFQAASYTFVKNPNSPEVDTANIYVAAVEGEIAQATAAEGNAARLVKLLSLSLGGLATLLGIGIAILIARSITRPLIQVQQAALQVSAIDVANLAEGLTALSQGNWTVTVLTGVSLPAMRVATRSGRRLRPCGPSSRLSTPRCEAMSVPGSTCNDSTVNSNRRTGPSSHWRPPTP